MSQRIVSLLASGTEIVAALGLEDRLVGISHECDYPPTVLDRPRVSRPRFDPEGMNSGQVDAAVREAMAEHGSVYEIDGDRLEALRPDLILTQAVCEVCAVPTPGVRDVTAERGLDAEIVSLDAHTIGEILDSIRAVGRAAGAERRATAVVTELERRLAVAEATVAGAVGPRVLAIEWLDPPFAPGHWVPEMIERANGRNLIGQTGAPSREVEWDDLAGLDPDVLVIMPCGYGLEASRRDADGAADRIAAVAPQAILSGRVFVVDGSSYFNRSGPRTVDGVEILAGLFHPDRFRRPPPEAAARWRPPAGCAAGDRTRPGTPTPRHSRSSSAFLDVGRDRLRTRSPALSSPVPPDYRSTAPREATMPIANRLGIAALLAFFAAAPADAQQIRSPDGHASPGRPADAGEMPTAQAAGPFTVDDAIDLASVRDPRLSPDGSRLIFTRRTLDWDENERRSRLWIADADGGDARELTAEEGDRHARWSPDGRRVAFLRSVDGEERTRQLFLLRMDGGEALQLTEHATSVDRFEWMPDGERIAFVADDTLSTEEKEAREEGYDGFLVDEGPNGQGPGRWSNLWTVAADPDGGEARPLTEGERMIGGFAVSPDGERVAFTFRTEDHRNDGFRSEIAVVDVASREIRRLTDNAAPEGDLAWSPDGSMLSFVAPDLESWRLDQGNLYVMDIADGTVRQLAADYAGDIGDYAWSPDGRAIHFTALERTVANLYRLDVASGASRPVTSLEGIVSSPAFSRDHGRVAFVFSSPTGPGDIFTAAFPDGDTTRVTDANPWLRDRTLAEPEAVRWRSDDGLEIEGLLYRPAGRAASPGAFVLEIHGGPAGVFSRRFDADAQILAAHGYAVLQPNVRGSTGYGDELLRGNMRDIGGGDYEDVMTGVDAMIERGIAHPDSLAVKGWSYGGILGGWTITRTDRFKAASLGAMVADWRSEYGAGFNFDVVRWYIGGDPWTERDRWIEMSSYSHMDRIETPTILFHGENDRTDTIQQTMNFHAALRRFGVPTRFVRFPREGHGIGEPRHARTRIVEELRWLQRWVRGDADWTAPERPTDAEETVAASGPGGV